MTAESMPRKARDCDCSGVRRRRYNPSRGLRRIAGALMLTTASLFGLAGCASLPPVTYVLLAPPNANRPPPQGSNWQVNVVAVPGYLDSTDIRYRTAPHVVDTLDNAKWAQPLPIAITSLLQTTINAKLETDRAKPYTVKVDLATFALQPSGQVVLSGRWRVTNRESDALVARDAVVIKEPLTTKKITPAGVASAMSRAVRQLTFRIVAAAG